MAESRLLISNYVSEARDENRRTARACNIAKYLIDNFSTNAGKRISIKELRNGIPNEFKDESLNPKGDLKAHGDAVNALNLGKLTKNKETFVDFSLPNLKRCTSWILGQGRKVGAIQLVRDEEETKDPLIRDDDLIDLGMEIPVDQLTEWELIFTRSLNKSWRERGLSTKQRSTLERIIQKNS